jgi:hypothetical protein
MCVKIVYPKRRTWLERVSEQIGKENICIKKKEATGGWRKLHKWSFIIL